MNNTIMEEYILAGVSYLKSIKQFTIQGITPFLVVLCTGLFPGIMLGDYWLILSIVMLLTSFVLMVTIIIIARTALTLKKRLIIHILIYFNWCFHFLMIETQWFTVSYGFNPVLILLYIPVIIIPVMLGRRNSKRIKKGASVSYPVSQNIGVGMGGLASGVIGIIIGKLFLQNVSNNVAINVVLICFSCVSSLLSIGFLSVQRLYYLQKLEISTHLQ